MKLINIKGGNKKILFATDLSKDARYAFAYVVSLANLYNAKIVPLRVLRETPDLEDSRIIRHIDSTRWEET